MPWIENNVEQNTTNQSNENYAKISDLPPSMLEQIPELKKEVDANTTKTKNSLEKFKKELPHSTPNVESTQEDIDTNITDSWNATWNPEKTESWILWENEDNLPTDGNWNEITPEDMWPEWIPEELNN